MRERVPVATIPFIAGMIAMLLILVALGIWTQAGARKATVTWIGGQSAHYAATHHGDNKPTFVQGSVLRLEKGRKVHIVRVTDVCAGSGCRTLDVSPLAFDALGIPRGRGIGRVELSCGRGGHKRMGKCLAGEDQ